MLGTIRAIETRLARENCRGFVYRYQRGTDGLSGEEGAFLACSFWLADALDLTGRTAEATKLFEQLLAIRNDVGLLSEEYDTERHRLVGNFPQAFSHVALVNTARNLCGGDSPSRQRRTT